MSELGSEPERDHFHMWVGHCITAWADLDGRLFEVFWRTLSCAQEQAAIVYYKTPGLDIRLTLTDELVRSVLPKTENGKQPHPDLKAWTSIKNDITRGLSVRRRIAHQPVRSGKVTVPLSNDETFGYEELEFSYYEIYVSETESLRGKPVDPNTLHVTNLINHEEEVRQLAARLHAFDTDVLAKRLPKPAEPSPRSM
jgi:hypothetical protein